MKMVESSDVLEVHLVSVSTIVIISLRVVLNLNCLVMFLSHTGMWSCTCLCWVERR